MLKNQWEKNKWIKFGNQVKNPDPGANYRNTSPSPNVPDKNQYQDNPYRNPPQNIPYPYYYGYRMPPQTRM